MVLPITDDLPIIVSLRSNPDNDPIPITNHNEALGIVYQAPATLHGSQTLGEVSRIGI